MNKFTTYESLETGKLREEVGQLEGRAYKPSAVEWVVRATQGGVVKLTARCDRAGVVHALGSASFVSSYRERSSI